MNLLDDLEDLVAFVVLAGICLVFSFQIVVPAFHDDSELTQVAIEDKTAPTIKGVEQDSSYDGTMNRAEVTLTTQVQDIGMPNPKYYIVKNDRGTGNDYEVDMLKEGAHYQINAKLDEYATSTYNMLLDNTKYEVKVQEANPTTGSPRAYVIQREVTK